MKRIILLICILLLLESAAGLGYKGNTVRSPYGNVRSVIVTLEYEEEGKIETQNKKFEDFRVIQPSEVLSPNEYKLMNVYYEALMADNTATVAVNQSVKEFLRRPFLKSRYDLEIRGKDGSLEVGLMPHPLLGNYFLAPGVGTERNYKGEESDNSWVHIFPREESMKDNYLLLFERGKENTLLITSREVSFSTSKDEGQKWRNLGPRWKFAGMEEEEKESFSLWLSPIHIGYGEDIETVKAKAGDIAHEALCEPSVVKRNVVEGYDHSVYTLWYRFERLPNDWDIDPFSASPHNYGGAKVKDTSVCSVYLPKGAVAYSGEEGLPAVFNSSGKNAIGMYFRDSINGPRRKEDMWFGNESAGGGFYVKKSGLKDGEVVRVSYLLPKEKTVGGMNLTVPKSGEEVVKAVGGKEGYRMIVADERYIEFSRKAVLASLVAVMAAAGAVVYTAIKRK